jgi:hemerythrin
MKNSLERRESDLSYRINFDEPIPDLIARLKREHRQFESKLAELEAVAANTFNKQSMKILEDLSGPIVRHAVEEEARVMRVIMHKAKEQAEESIKIAQEHNWIADFIKKTVPTLASMPQQQAKQEVTKFVQNLRNHFIEEEQVMFPLALRADSLQ